MFDKNHIMSQLCICYLWVNIDVRLIFKYHAYKAVALLYCQIVEGDPTILRNLLLPSVFSVTALCSTILGTHAEVATIQKHSCSPSIDNNESDRHILLCVWVCNVYNSSHAAYWYYFSRKARTLFQHVLRIPPADSRQTHNEERRLAWSSGKQKQTIHQKYMDPIFKKEL